MRWPIRLQILLPFAVLLAAALAAVTLLDARLAAARSERQIVEQLRSIVRTLDESSFPLSDAVLRQMHGLSGAEFVLTDPTGSPLAASGTLALPPGAADEPRQAADDLQFSASAVAIDSRRFVHATTPIRPRGTAAAPSLLHILYPQDFLERARREATYPHLVVGAVAVVLAGLLSLAVAARISRPLQQVRRQAATLLGDAPRPLAVPRRNDELRDLVLSFNALAGELDELRAAVRRSERLAILGRLSGGIAHTLRNHCTGATMALQLHQRRCRDDAESLEVALRQLRLTSLYLERFLTAGHRQSIAPVASHLATLAAEVLESVAPACRHRGIVATLRHEPSADDTVLADPQLLRQLLLNLALNAIDAAGHGGWLRIELEAVPGAFAARVVDGGPGPPAELLDRLFEPFVTGKPEGIGLGLATARQIAEAHGGRLEYRRRDGATCFELTLPVRREASADRVAAAGATSLATVGSAPHDVS